MNVSRLAVLAVFFMMVMSAFVAVPAYNVSAEDHNDEEHDHDEDNGDHNDHGLPSFSDLDENGNGTIEFNELMTICPEDQSEDQCRGIFDQYSGDDGVIDENEYQRFVSDVTSPDDGPESMMVCYDIDTHEIDFSITTPEACNEAGLMWVSANSGPNDGDDRGDDNWDIENLRVHIKMESLGDWLVTLEGDYPVDESNNFREDLAQFCADMMGGSGDEITQDCYEQFLMMGDDDGHDGHGDHNGHDDDHGCPPDMSDETCEQWEDCDDNGMNMSCMRILYDYCDTSSHCSNDPYETPDDCYDDDGEPCGPNPAYFLFAYEDGSIGAEEFVDSMMDSFDIEGGSDENHDDCNYYYGDNEDRCEMYDNPGLYQMNTITVDVDQQVTIHANFENTYMGAPSFICGDGTEIGFYHVNNNTVDCEDGADEQWYDNYTDDTSDDCQKAVDEDCEGAPVNWFDCHDGTQVWINQVNDGNLDCEDGEDESWSYDSWNYWYGDIYLLEGEYDYVPGPDGEYGNDLTPDEVFAVQGSYCEWEDTNKTNVDCDDYIRADLVANQVYTLVTMTQCYEHWEYSELDCENFGIYNHTMVYDDGSETGIAGEIYSSPKGYCGGCWDHDGDDDDFVQASAANFSHDLSSDDDSYSNFHLYNAQTFVVDADGFEGYLISSGYACEEMDGFVDCWGADQDVYLYDAFDTTDTFSGIINMSDYGYSEDWDCPVDYCHFKYMNLELDEGDYVIVTTTNGDYYADTILNNTLFDTSGNSLTSWGAELRNAYYEYDDGERTLVTGDDRLHFPGWWNWYMDNYDHGDYDDHDDHDDNYHVFMALMENFTTYEEDNSTAVEVADNLVEIMYMMDEMGMFGNDDDDHDDYMSLDSFAVSSWDSVNDLEAIIDWYNSQFYHHDSHTNMTVDDFLTMCEGISDEVNEEVAQCVLDKALNMLHDEHGDHHDDHDDHGDHDDHDDHGDHDDHDDNDGDDNPAMLDGIAGIQDPQDAGDNCRPSADDPHLLGSVSDNEDHPLSCSFEFKISFEGVDNSLENHEAYIPFEDEQVWTLKIEMLEGYEFISCDNCDVDDEGVMTGSGPVKITFAKAEPQPDCDYVVGLSADGMAFDPVKLAIKAGETVCWQWKDASMAHNVLELEGEYDSTMNLTNINFGFSSGEPAMTVDYRHTFTENDKVHYYVCEPHAQLGMVGQITVGNGTEDPVQQALEDNEVPSIGFVVGSLVLIGAAGLRRRVH